MLGAVAALCWRGYRQRPLWFSLPISLLLAVGHGRGFLAQLLLYGPLVVGGLLLCHWINGRGWHATAAAGILVGMTAGLEAMRRVEAEGRRARAGAPEQ